MVPSRYNLTNLKRAIDDPSLISREVRRLRHPYVVAANNALFDLRHGEGLNIVEQDWDQLILLDACRYDFFAEADILEGDLRPVVSKGSHSWEFMQGNFVGKRLHDTVYVSANPYAMKLPDDTFYTVKPLLDRWDPELETVLPEDVVEATIEQHQEYPHKRLIVHFMQPHRPFLGPTARRVRTQFDITGYDIGKFDGDSPGVTGESWFSLLDAGHVTWEETERAYRESLELALEHIGRLIDSLPGKSVVSADHGQMLGERLLHLPGHAVTGHPPGLRTKQLRRVPWLEVPSENRREITAETPIGFDRPDEEIVNRRLQALGYSPE